MHNESTQTPPKSPVHEHIESSTVAGIDASVPGYHLKFFVSHKTVTDTNSTELDKIEQSANNQNNNVAKR